MDTEISLETGEMKKESHEFAVYLFKSSKEKAIELDGKLIHFNTGDIYYVGEGNENRIKHMNRNADCNFLTTELDGYLEVVQSNITKKEAIALEEELINEMSDKYYLANKSLGNKLFLNKEKIPEIKFLIELDRQGIIDISMSELEWETRTTKSAFHKIQDTEEYIVCIPKPPDNLLEILSKYKPKEEDKQRLLGELKYCINLIDKGVLKMSLKELYEFFDTSHANAKEARDVFLYEHRPDEEILIKLLSKYGFHVLSEKDIRDGRVLSAINLKEKLNLSVTDSKIAEILNVNLARVADVKRSNRDAIKPLELEPDIIAKMLSGELFYLGAERGSPKNEKFEWHSPTDD